jgi:hypothetical protein
MTTSAPEIRIDQVRPSGTSTGTPGRARKDLWNGRQINLVLTGTGTAPTWTILAQPVGSSITLNNPTSATAWFTPTVLGTYRVQLTVTNASAAVVQLIALARCTLDLNGNPVLSFTQYEPAPYEVGAESNYAMGGSGPYNDRGWDERRGALVAALDSTLVCLPSATCLASQINADGGVQHVLLDNLTVEGDGLGGVFRWSAASTTAHDGVNVIQPYFGSVDPPPLAVGRWERLGMTAPTGAWTPIPEFSTIDATPVDKRVYTFPTAPPGFTYAGSTVQVQADMRATGAGVASGDVATPATHFSSGAYAIGSGPDSAVAGDDTVTGELPYDITAPKYTIYCSGLNVYLRTVGLGSTDLTFNGEYLVKPQLRLTALVS